MKLVPLMAVMKNRWSLLRSLFSLFNSEPL